MVPEASMLRFFAGALYQFQLFESKWKERSYLGHVTGPSRTKFLSVPLPGSTISADLGRSTKKEQALALLYCDFKAVATSPLALR